LSTRPQKINFVEMRSSGMRCLLVNCANSSSGFASRNIATPRTASRTVRFIQEVFAIADSGFRILIDAHDDRLK